MRSRTTGAIVLVSVMALGAGACGRGAEEQAPAASSSPAGTQKLDIQLTPEAAPLKTGTARMDVLVREEGKPVTDADVTLELHMPPSGAMGEMRTGVELTPAGDGHYTGSVDVMMAGKWDAIVRVKRGGQVLATHTEPVTAQ